MRAREIFTDCMVHHTTVLTFDGKYRFLSNFWPSEVEFEGVCFPTVEHAFQTAKTRDLEARERIRSALTPGNAKRLGREVDLRGDWEDIKVSVMHQLLIQKFDLTPLGEWLLHTGRVDLVEGNTWKDTFWGVCDGKGRNELGRLLMLVRSELVYRKFFVNA